MIALQNVYIRRYVCFRRDSQFDRELHLKETDRSARMAVYTNLQLVQQCKHLCCDWSLALHFAVIKELIHVGAPARPVTFMHRKLA